MSTMFAALGLLLATPAQAAGPAVPAELLATVPDEVLGMFAERHQAITSLDAQIEAQRAGVEKARIELEAEQSQLGEARSDMSDAQGTVDAAKAGGRTRLQTAKNEAEQTKIKLDTARRKAAIAKQDVKLAKKKGDPASLNDAKLAYVDAKQATTDAADEHRRRLADLKAVKKDVTTDVEGVKVAAGDARDTTTKAKADLNEARLRMAVAKSEVALLEAERNVLVTQLEHDRARAVQQAGGTIDVKPFVDAVAQADAALTKAKGAHAARLAELAPANAEPAPAKDKPASPPTEGADQGLGMVEPKVDAEGASPAP